MQTSSRSGPTASSARPSKRNPTTFGGSKTSSNTLCWCGTTGGSLLALDLIVIVGFDGCFKRVNPAFERTLAYPLRTLESRPFLEVIHPEDFAWPRSMFDEFVRDDRHDRIGVEHRVVCRDGSVPWFQLNSRVLAEGEASSSPLPGT